MSIQPAHVGCADQPFTEARMPHSLEALRQIERLRSAEPLHTALTPRAREALAQYYGPHCLSNFIYCTTTSLQAYETKLGGPHIREFISQRLAQNDQPVSILDIGCGNGQALVDLRNAFGDRVRLSATTIGSTATHAIDRLWNGPAELLPADFAASADLVLCFTSLCYHLAPEITLRVAAAALKPGGEAWIQGRPAYGLDEEQMEVLLAADIYSAVKKFHSGNAGFNELLNHLQARGPRGGGEVTPAWLDKTAAIMSDVYHGNDVSSKRLIAWYIAIEELRRAYLVTVMNEKDAHPEDIKIVRSC